MSTINLEEKRKFRGKFLGEVNANNIGEFIDRHNITTGTFKDLHVGDYFISVVKTDRKRVIIFRIADLDVYEDTTSTASLQHHICIVPDGILCGSCMYEQSDNWESHGYEQSYMGYEQSYMNCTIMPMINKAMEEVFGSHLLEYTELLSVDNKGTVEQFTVKGILMSEMEMFGKREYSLPETDVIINKQLALFAERPDFIETDSWCNWLRDIYSLSYFVYCYADGSLAGYDATNSYGVRPRFLLG